MKEGDHVTLFSIISILSLPSKFPRLYVDLSTPECESLQAFSPTPLWREGFILEVEEVVWTQLHSYEHYLNKCDLDHESIKSVSLKEVK